MALVAVVIAMYAGEGWWHGRLWKPWVIVQQWMRIRELRAHVDLNPHDRTARADLGRLLVERKQYAEALPHLEEVVRREPQLAFPAYHLGLARLGTGDFEGGRQAIEQALAIRRDLHYGEPLVRLGDFLAERGKHAEALVYYELASATHASSVEIVYKIGVSRAASGDVTGAAEALKEAQRVYAQAPPFKRRLERAWAWRAWWLQRKVSGAARKRAA